MFRVFLSAAREHSVEFAGDRVDVGTLQTAGFLTTNSTSTSEKTPSHVQGKIHTVSV